MKALTIVWAAAVAVGGVVACSSSNSNGNGNGSGGNSFPFSGPSCPAGMTAPSTNGMPASAACSSCVNQHCSSSLSCVATDCKAFFTCFCACAMGDFQCIGGCVKDLDSTCQTCTNGIGSCESQNCSSACTPTLDGG